MPAAAPAPPHPGWGGWRGRRRWRRRVPPSRGTQRVRAASLPRRLPGQGLRRRVEPFLNGFLDTFAALLRQPRLILVALAYTLVAVGFDALFCLLAFRAV